MAESRTSVRFRTTAVAVLVVAAALLVGAVVLVALVRDSLRDGLEATAEQRASAIAAEIRVSGLPASEPSGEWAEEALDEDDDEDLVWQVADADGAVLRSSRPLRSTLEEDDRGYLVVTEDADPYTVLVGVSLEEVADSTAALVTPLMVGVPSLLLLVGGTVWVVAGRALAPIERIRREVEEITGDRLDRRVPEPRSRDEVHRMARTMNQMLGRLQDSRDRQQQFVADASHELRSPLASIRQAAEVARDHPGALPEGELTAAVLEESARMQRLVEQLLLLTRDGVGRAPHDVDLDDLALAEARRVARSGLEVDTAGVGAGRVRGDPTALAQIVRNLVDNAARHATGTVAIAVRETGDGVEIIVEDDGAGVPPEHRERIFERFVRLDEARTKDAGGSGLGLAIVKETVTAHGGTVTVATSALGGARFVVRLAVNGLSGGFQARTRTIHP
ncbi:Signal transduction histidine kinase [Asanoa hainanensis]|uniref:histidine kinase n=1 Tax=Asanoa hainanensis TaxID=560556 RepID=A0A239P0G0_9ACTN|nr:ATP-binding protein [Asanoa hainanensis]SNT60611.1 Signal transduction histidine kinase [Asanoa hainanensis]